MRKALTLAMAVSTLGSVFSAYAGSINLSNRIHVPLYDCEIFRDREDRRVCKDLTLSRRFAYSEQGDAVNCREEFVRSERSSCMELADKVTYDGSAFDCYPLPRLAQRKCEETKNAYQDGFISTDNYSREVIVAPAPTLVVREVNNSCNQRAYDEAYSRWIEAKEKQKSRGTKRTVFGVAAILGGAVLGSSNNGVTRAVGNTMMIGGAVVTAMGLIDMSEADMALYSPHLMAGCRDNYIYETRRVVVDRQQCTSTRYTERHGWGSSRSYYEVSCSTKRYVTYERFTPYEESSYVVVGIR